MRAFDVRAVTKEQVESMGATFLEVPLEEDGAGAGGYAKVCLKISMLVSYFINAQKIKSMHSLLDYFLDRKCQMNTRQHRQN